MTHPTLEQIADAIGVLKQAGLLPRTSANGRISSAEVVSRINLARSARPKKRKARNVLTQPQIERAYRLHKEGVSGVKLAKQFGVSQGQMSRRLKDRAAK